MTPDQNTTHRSFVFGDFDKDKTPNLDDKYPFNPEKKEQVEEVMLTDELREINKHNVSHKGAAFRLIEKYKNSHKVIYRIKAKASTIGKLRRKFIDKVLDVAAITIIAKSPDDIKHLRDDVKRSFKVIKENDFYASPAKEHRYYKAIHLTVILDGKPVEVQIKTKGHQALHKESHSKYKQYKPLPRSVHDRYVRRSNEIERKGL